jgi:hypothetical protein
VIRTEEEHLAHYGVIRRSGRYPWGSGTPEDTRNRDFLDNVAALKKKGLSDNESYARAQVHRTNVMQAQRMRNEGWSHRAIGERMGGMPESTVRALLRDGEKDKSNVIYQTSEMLKRQVAEKEMIDVGKGVEAQLGITYTRLNTAVTALKEIEGYAVHTIHIPQLAMPGKYTIQKVLAKPGTTKAYVDQNRAKIRLITEYSDDHGRSFYKPQPPLSVSSRRVKVNWNEDGGGKVDGVIYVRPGVKDLSIGENKYGQVRIMVDNTHYLKGMAVYKDDLPDGVDLLVNTKKPNTGRKKDAMKELDNPDDPNNPFGAIIRQVIDPATNKVTSAINMVGSPTKPGSGEEGSWDTWNKALSSQMLSKQDPKFAKQQLDVTFDRHMREYDEISSLTNPTVRRDLLLKFADKTDSSAVDLQAASLKRTANKVLLPIPSMKSTEIYAPGFREGERVVLIRHPHSGPFEIPELTVNNKNREARKMIGTGPGVIDAVGIHDKVAKQLSGADFDGDTVLVIPNRGRQIKTDSPLVELKGFDPMDYKIPDDAPIPRMTKRNKQTEMGKISNLITDMSLQGADHSELARAVKHSMVVIDAEKHGLDYRQSAKDNGIPALKEKFQGTKTSGARTLISRARSPEYVPHRVERPASKGGPIDPVTGKRVYVKTGQERPVLVKDPVTGKTVKSGRMVPRTIKSEKLAEAEDAFSLIEPPGTQMELLYAGHSNRLKALANNSRKEAIGIKNIPYSKSARKVYSDEVASLNSKLRLAEKNAPYERQAQLLGNANLGLKRQANPGMTTEEIKRERTRALNDARTRTGASRFKIRPTQDEWHAIQAGAISGDKLEKILRNSDPVTIKKLAMPKPTPKMSSTMTLRAQAMLAQGYTQQQVADQLGVGLTTLKVAISE